MSLSEFIQKIKKLSLPENSYVVFGSGPLLLRGIRGCDDIDLLVSEEIYEKLKLGGWAEKTHCTEKNVLVNGIYEVGKDWVFGNYNPALGKLLATADRFEGVPFANLEEVLKWKTAYGRKKDHKDIMLIRKYFCKGKNCL